MGYQQSFIKFKDLELLKSELIKYNQRNSEYDLATVYGVVKIIKPISPFEKNELALVMGGERSEQRNTNRLKEGLGIENAQEIVFIDNPYYWELSDGNIGELLDEHFQTITKDEYE